MIIKNGKIAFSGEKYFHSRDLKIEQGKIAEIGSNLLGETEIDADGLQIFPGAIDPHVHFDEPGYTDREDFYHGSCAAASGGVTTVIDMPCTSVPPVTNIKNLKQKLEIVRQKSVVDFGFFGGVSGQCFDGNFQKYMTELADYVLGFKTYFISGMNSFSRLDLNQFQQVLKIAKELNRPALLHAEDYEMVTTAEASARVKGSGWHNYYNSRPEAAEIIAVRNSVEIAEEIGAELHIVHIGTAEAAKLLSGKNKITGETAPHYLEFSYDDLERIGGALKTAPVVKSPGNADGLWQALMDGTLDFVASDHAPALENQKNTGSAWNDYSGIPGTGTLFPYLYSEGFVKRNIGLNRFLKITAENAAWRYGLFDRKGSIEIGKDADLALVDPNARWTVNGRDFISKGKITPFEGMTFQGRVVKTIIRGQVVFDREKGITAQPGFGKFLTKRVKAEH
ncbi:MAG: amidohydrolase family protein [Candidatus Marinimicrobia bacterium]|nr:amidohydrolase family protein [Candidatus Neomarinimicrobiota bacterium]